MRSLGIDFGEKRIGVAISDEEGRLATPLSIIERRTDRQAIGVLREIADREGVGRLVVGKPHDDDGCPTEMAERIERFAARLAAALRLPLVFTDERLTSVQAEQELRDAGVDVRRHPGRVDMLAARILLQDVLDAEAAGA